MALYHVTFAARRRAVLFPTEAHQRAAVRCLARAVGDKLALFNAMDEHGHATLEEQEKLLAKLEAKLRSALSTVSAEPIVAVWDERVEDPKHARSLVRYTATQTIHHESGVHPALQSGSCAHELLGTRKVPGLTLRTELVGRPSESTVLGHLGLSQRPLVPVTDEQIRELGACRLRAAVTAALAVGPKLDGRAAPVVLARHVTAHMAVAAGIPRSEIAHALEVPPNSICYMLGRPVPVDVVVAVRMRLALEQAVAVATGCTFRLGRR
jgi:hypothetical protein